MYDFNKHLQQSWCTRSSRTSALFFKANGAQVWSAFCAYIFRAKKKVKKKILWTGRCGQLMPVSSWWLWMCPYSQHAFEIPSICLYCERIKNWGLLLTDGSLCSEYREGCLRDYRGKTAWMVAWIVHCPTRCGGLAPGVKTWHSPWPRGSPLLRGEGNWCAGVGLRDQESPPAFCYHAPRGLKSPGS